MAQLEFSPTAQEEQPSWLRPGVVGQVVFEIRPRQAFKVKEEALIFEGDQPMVRVVEDGKIRRVQVRVGAKSNGFVEILDGMEDGMWLVDRAPGILKDGQSVTVQ
jgi:multidrug efflux pump subunit AcrA (membrane-fusion protein)